MLNSVFTCGLTVGLYLKCGKCDKEVERQQFSFTRLVICQQHSRLLRWNRVNLVCSHTNTKYRELLRDP